ncbi:MAG TPA: sugar ABC transporter permease [Thermotogota bacterium]|nr:sugar ABC transporter permease [Thermotogota bacterium]HRW91901.1 sugar ABC transporter permease [Thermotogota bacterium]
MRKFLPYLLLIPTFLVIILFIYWPAADSFRMSLYKVSPFGNRMIYTGLGNFQKVFSSAEYRKAVLFTTLYVPVTVLLTIFISFFLALLLNQNVPGTRFYRTFIFAPYAVSPAIAGTLWTFLLNPVVGHVNYFFMAVFGTQVEWLTTKPYALIALFFASVWKMMPFDIIFYIAGLQSVPDELMESATLDGAGVLKKMWRIQFPMVSPITFYLVIMNIIVAMFSSFAIIDVMTKGGPGGYTTTMMYRLYLDAFAFQKTGPASAQSVIMFGLMAIITVIYFVFGERRVHYR